MGVALNATTIEAFENNFTISTSTAGPVLSERERVRMEFYQTYDVMTGIRIAATLGSFFTMMVLLVLYKSKCKSRVDESLEAAITAVVAEEQELEAVLSQTKYEYSGCIHRQSLGNMSAPAYTRFSSVGGYGSLMNPPKRYERGTRGRISLPASDISFRYFKSAPTSICSQDQKSVFWKSYNEEEENELEEAEENEESTDVKFLQVPNQRLKFNLTDGSPFCIGRRGSCSTIEFLSQMNNEMKQQHSDNQTVHHKPNIQVIEATPQISPCESSSGLQDEQRFGACCTVAKDGQSSLAGPERRLAPLASIGSCSAISSIDSENRSMGSDSVFINNDVVDEDDTDKDQNEEELSSSAKSDQHDDCTNKKYRILPPAPCCEENSSSNSLGIINAGSQDHRRFSDPSLQICCSAKSSDDTKSSAISMLPIVTNLAGHAAASCQTTTSIYHEMVRKDSNRSCSGSGSSSSSSTSLSSHFSRSNSTTSSVGRKRGTGGVYSRIAIIDVSGSSVKNDDHPVMPARKKLFLSKSEPKAIYKFSNHSIKEMRTLSLKNLDRSENWNKETLF